MQTRPAARTARREVVAVLGVWLRFQSGTVALVKRRPSSEVRQREPLPAIAAEGVPDHRKHGIQVPDRDLAPVTDLPTSRCVVEGERSDLAVQRPGYLIFKAYEVRQWEGRPVPILAPYSNARAVIAHAVGRPGRRPAGSCDGAPAKVWRTSVLPRAGRPAQRHVVTGEQPQLALSHKLCLVDRRRCRSREHASAHSDSA
jgi:hypothetical protein